MVLSIKQVILTSVLSVLAFAVQAQTQKVEVLEYHPAPGQFVNTLPSADENTTQEEVNQRCEEQLNSDALVHLGTFGGYITVKFDHAIENKPGSDFLVLGNGFYANADPIYGAATIGGSIEPGIVYVGVGKNLESAKWYELAGSEYYTSEIHDFEISYHKPTAESGVHSQSGSSHDNYIKWECSWTDKNGERRDSTGYHCKNVYHRQSYWPLWEGKDELTFKGGKLPNNAIDTSGKGTYWVQYRYAKDAYGYADACPATDSLYSSFDINWAVDDEGNQVVLDHIDFIRVKTGIFQYCGWLGETSTEVSSVVDLHLVEGYDDNPYIITPRKRPSTGIQLPTVSDHQVQGDAAYYTLTGQRVERVERGKIYIHKGKKVVF
uniref:PKD domain-containing protein n=1 Tax=Prevotella sp. TaxID=59823 RepID=UPI003FEE471B